MYRMRRQNPGRAPRSRLYPPLPAARREKSAGISRLRASSPAELQASKGFRNMVRRDVGRLPGDEFLLWWRTLNAVEIDAHLVAFGGSAHIDTGHGDAHFAVPNFVFFVETRFDLKAGIPGPAAVWLG